MQQPAAAPKRRRPDDVRYIGALNGCYALSERRGEDGEAIPVYACRLVSLSTAQAVIVAPVLAQKGEVVVMHFKDFGILRAHVARPLPTGLVLDLLLDDTGRDKLAAKIRWKKASRQKQAPDKREYPRTQPRQPRSVLTMADGTLHACFVIDISQSGAAVSAAILPKKGTPLAVGALVGRVVRRLEVGFAVEFTSIQSLEGLERRLAMQPG